MKKSILILAIVAVGQLYAQETMKKQFILPYGKDTIWFEKVDFGFSNTLKGKSDGKEWIKFKMDGIKAYSAHERKKDRIFEKVADDPKSPLPDRIFLELILKNGEYKLLNHYAKPQSNTNMLGVTTASGTNDYYIFKGDAFLRKVDPKKEKNVIEKYFGESAIPKDSKNAIGYINAYQDILNELLMAK